MPERSGFMGYRKVGYMEQLWYIFKYMVGRLLHRR